jgi:hypothetical protein
MLVKKKNKKIFGFVLILLLLLFTVSLVGVDFAYAQGVDSNNYGLDEVGGNTGLGNQDLRVTVGKIIKIFLGFLGVVALGIVLYAGFLYMTSGGSPEKVETAKKWMINGVVGLIIILSAYAIVAFVFKGLTEATGYSSGSGNNGESGYIPSSTSTSFYVQAVSPMSAGAPINSKVRLTFSKSVNPETITAENIKITKTGDKQIVTTVVKTDEVIDPNGNGDVILQGVAEDDGIVPKAGDAKWTVCGGTHLGGNPIVFKYDLADVVYEESLSAKVAYDIPSMAGNKAFMNVTCGPTMDTSAQNELIGKAEVGTFGEVEPNIGEWLPNLNENELNIPPACLTGDNDEIFIRWERTGSNCLTFDYHWLEFEFEEFVAGAEVEVPGTFEMETGNRVAFIPAADCQDEACSGNKCFDKNTEFTVKVIAGGVKSATGTYGGVNCTYAGSKCLSSFSTSEICDVEAPVVWFTSPAHGSKVPQENEIDVSVKVTDDAGISSLDLFVEDELYDSDPPADSSLLEHEGFFNWLTYDVPLGWYKLGAAAGDLDDHVGQTAISVKVLPEYCFDDEGIIICDATGEHPECGACDGNACTSDDDCAGVCVFTCDNDGLTACSNDEPVVECPEGQECSGICTTEPVITDIAPAISGPGNLISIAGVGFLNYGSEASHGQVYFSGGDGNINIPGAIGCDPNSAWNNNQVVVKVPDDAVTGPIKLVNRLDNFDTTDDDDGYTNDFIVDPSVNYPGLCAVHLEDCLGACDEGPINELVEATGDNFLALGQIAADDDDELLFGNIPALAGSGYGWDVGAISGAQIPALEIGMYNATVTKGEKCTDSESGEECESTDENVATCICKPVYSNPVKFKVVPVDYPPVIEEVEKNPAHLGELVTISGLNFGSQTGLVEFYREIGGQPYEWAAALGCGSNSWTNTEITIRVPEEIGDLEAPYGDEYELRLSTAEGIDALPIDFEIVEGPPSPGLCALLPDNGPEGLAVSLVGEYFGVEDLYTIYFSKTGGPTFECPDDVALCDVDKDPTCTCTKTPDEGVAVSSHGVWNPTLITDAVVPDGAVPGGVFLQNDEGDRSNTIKFNVGSCTSDSCAEGLSCCSNGACQAECTVETVYSPSEFMWSMSTGPLPQVLAVLERTCVTGAIAQSPSPYKSTVDACPNGVISATFNMSLKGDDFNNENTLNYHVEMRRCTTPGQKCNFAGCDEENNATDSCIYRKVKSFNFNNDPDPGGPLKSNDVGSDNSSYICTIDGDPLSTACNPGKDEFCICSGSGNSVTQFGLLEAYKEPLNAMIAGDGNPGVVNEVDLGGDKKRYDLFTDTWYEITIVGGPTGVRKNNNLYLPQDYVWEFKTQTDLCIPDNLLMRPLIGLITGLYGTQQYRVSGQYQCQEIALNNEDWAWGVDAGDADKIEHYAYGCADGDATVCPVEEDGPFRKDIGYYKLTTPAEGQPIVMSYETSPYTPYEIFTEAVPADGDLAAAFETLYKRGFLEVIFGDPKVIAPYPVCDTACINGIAGAFFNTKMDVASLNNNTVKVYECFGSDCVVLTEIVPNVDYHWGVNENTGNTDSELIIAFDPNLEPNQYYRVVLTDQIQSVNQKYLTGLNYSTTSDGAGDCSNNEDDDLDGKFDLTGGYENPNDDDGTLDYICGCYDDVEDEFITYNEADINIQCSEEEDENIFIACITQSNDALVAEEAALAVIMEENDYYAPDANCATVDDYELGDVGVYDAYSWIFKTKNDPEECDLSKVEVTPNKKVSEILGEKSEFWVTASSIPDECSVAGQKLNPYAYSWAWESTDEEVVYVMNTSVASTSKPYCGSTCLALGSNPFGAVCGNGAVEPGEECEGGDNCTDNCLLMPVANCANDGQANCCGNQEVESGEECDQGCEWKDIEGEECTAGADNCTCVSLGAACTDGCQNAGTDVGFMCGNGVLEPGEDADYGSDNGLFKLTGNCLNTGSTYVDGSVAAGAVCGNAIFEPGEECEALCELPDESSCEKADEGVDGCVCSINNNPLCTSTCTWVAFPSCAGGCTKTQACVSGDPGCVGNRTVACDEGSNCIGERMVACSEAADDCVACADDDENYCSQEFGQREISCYMGVTAGCANGQKEETCYLGDAGCVGEKAINCNLCVDGNVEVNCKPNTAGCDESGKKIVSCDSCENEILAVQCSLSEVNCVDDKKEVSCNLGDEDPDCSCDTCCGNGVSENYPGGKIFEAGDINYDFDEECEAVCTNSVTSEGCNYGTENCVCTFPSTCTNTCLNKGSSYENKTFCNDGLLSDGEDFECECSGEGACVPGADIKGAPYTIGITGGLDGEDGEIDYLKQVGGEFVFSYNIVTGYVQGTSDIKVIDNDSAKFGIADFKYRTNDPDVVELYKDILPHVEDWDDVYPPNTIFECKNQIDDDGDGFCDYEGCTVDGVVMTPDPQCDSELDLSESLNPNDPPPPAECSNLIDDDDDGLCDFGGCTIDGVEMDPDPVCEENPLGLSESVPWNLPQCSDGQDNDGDGLCDHGGCDVGEISMGADPGCQNADDDSENNIIACTENFVNIAVSNPPPGAINVCTNSLMYITLDQPIFEGEGFEVRLEQADTTTCPAAGDVGFWNGLYKSIKGFAQRTLLKVGLAAGGWCDNVVPANIELSSGATGNTVITIQPQQVLAAETTHRVVVNGALNNCDEDVSVTGLSFTVGKNICRMDGVYIDPDFVFINQQGQVTNFAAMPTSGTQPVIEIPGVYEWNYVWSVDDETLIEGGAAGIVPNATGEQAVVTNGGKAGVATLEVTATITMDEIPEILGGQATSTVNEKHYGYSKLQMLICDNLWDPGAYAPYVEVENGVETTKNKWVKMQEQLDSGEYYTTYILEDRFNVGLFYCRDFGADGFHDDLPKIDIGIADFIKKDIVPRKGIFFDESFDYVRAAGDTYMLDTLANKAWTVESWVFSEEVPDDRYARLFYKNLDSDPNTDYHVQLTVRKWGTGCEKNGAVCEWSYTEGPNTNDCEVDTCSFSSGIYFVIKNENGTITRAANDAEALFSEGFNHIALSYDGNNSYQLWLNGDPVATENETTALQTWLPKEDADGNGNWDPVSPEYNDLFIGGAGMTDIPYLSFNGYVDEFRVWDDVREPTLEDVVNTDDPHLRGLWRFDSDVQDVKNNFSIAECSINHQKSKCSGNEFFYINLTELAKIKGLLDEGSTAVWQDLSQDSEHQCNDGIDNDNNGVADFGTSAENPGDPKCGSFLDPWEEPKLFEQYFFTRTENDPNTDYAPDVISLRIYENPEALPPEIWYQKYAPNPGSTSQAVKVDCQKDLFGEFCYVGAQDGRTLYVAASNLKSEDGGLTTNVYNNIYVLGYSDGANEATMNIYTQLVNNLLMNTDLVVSPDISVQKVKLIRDTQRVMDMVMMRNYLNIYKQTPPHNGSVPQLESGTYVRGRTFSVWPSWQEELGSAMTQTLPTDPLNHFLWQSANNGNSGVQCMNAGEYVEDPGDVYYCPVPEGGQASDYQCVVPKNFCVKCPSGYDTQTCYNSSNYEFFNLYDENPNMHPVYSFEVDPLDTGSSSSYKINFIQELLPKNIFRVVPAFGETLAGGYSVLPQVIGTCNDGIDNDNDDDIDFPDDSDCSNDSDQELPECMNGIDDDDDGFTDYPNDTGCDAANDSLELLEKQCSDGADNDGDTLIDFTPGLALPIDLSNITNEVGCTDSEDDDENKRGLPPTGNVLVSFFVDTSTSMKSNDTNMYFKDMIKGIINGIDDDDGSHIKGLSEVLGDRAFYMMGTSGRGANPEYYYEGGFSEQLADPAIAGSGSLLPGTAQNFVTYLDTQNDENAFFSGYWSMACRIKEVWDATKDEFNANKNGAGNDYKAMIYVVITDANDDDCSTERSNTITEAKSYLTPIHFIYINSSKVLGPTVGVDGVDQSEKNLWDFWRHYYTDYTGVSEKYRGIWMQGSEATLKSALGDIINAITSEKVKVY